MPAGQIYQSYVPQTTLSSGITSGATILTVASATGWPASTPFAAVIDVGNSSQEIVQVTAVAGASFTITRGIDGGSGQAHSSGATVTHCAIARDFRDFRAHLDASSSNDAQGLSVHGLAVSSSVVGTTDTQTLTNKTITNPVLNGSGGLLTLPAGPETIVGRATTDTLSNKTLTSPTINTPTIGAGTMTTSDTVISSNLSGNHPVTITALANQTGDFFRIKNAGGTNLFDVAANGTGHMGNVIISPDETANTSLVVNAPSGTTSNVVDFQINAASRWSVSSGGNFVAANSSQIDLTNSNSTQPILGAAWATYTPTWTANAGTPSIGNGTLGGRYIQYGKTVFFSMKLVIGSTTSQGTDWWAFTLPVNANFAATNFAGEMSVFGRPNNGLYVAIANIKDATTFNMIDTGTRALWGAVGIPAAWGAGNYLVVSGTYEAA